MIARLRVAMIVMGQEVILVCGTRIDLAAMWIEDNLGDRSGIRLQDLLDTPMGIRSSPPGTQTGDRWVTGRGPGMTSMRTGAVMGAETEGISDGTALMNSRGTSGGSPQRSDVTWVTKSEREVSRCLRV